MTPDSTRRGGVPARPVRLADGADWGLARPTVRLFPRVVTSVDGLGRPVEGVKVETGFGYPLEVERLVQRVRSACERESVQDQYEAFIALTAALLVRAHEISLATACELLAVSEDELPQLVREVMGLVSSVGRTGCSPRGDADP